MRIVSGKYGGRRLFAPQGRFVRPTTDKVRGAIFNMLRSRNLINDAIVLDGFCGTGALGLEALSQGANYCTFIDNQRESVSILKKNIKALGIEDKYINIYPKDITKIAQRPDNIRPATLVFLDPPYNKELLPASIEALYKNEWLAQKAVIICESEKNRPDNFPPFVTLENTRTYGDTKIATLFAP